MSKKKIGLTVLISSISFIVILIVFTIVFYLTFLPKIVKSDFTINQAQKITKSLLKLDLEIINPNLRTYLKPTLDFSVDKLTLKNKNEVIINLEKFNTSISFNNILNKEIKLNYINASSLIFKLNELIDALPKQEQKQEVKPFDWKIDIFDANAKLDNFELSFVQNKTLLDIMMCDIEIYNENDYKSVGFNFEAIVSKNNKQYLDIIASTIDEIKIKEDELTIENFRVLINNSRLLLNSKLNKEELSICAKSDKFLLADIFNIINSVFIFPSGEEYLKILKNPSGKVVFDVDYKNGDLSGYILIDNTKADLKDLSNIPLNVQKGKIVIYKDKIDFQNLSGYYGKNKNNTLKVYGDIKDYYKTFDSNITIDTVITNEFFNDYLSPLIAGTSLYISKPAGTRILYKAKNNIMDVTWLAKIAKGVNLSIKKGEKSSLINFDRAIKGDFHIEGNNLDIKNINYYISQNINKGVKLTPVVIIDGKTTLDGKIDNIGFSFGREMPCELLNVFTKAKTFKKGTIKGNLHVKFKDNIPVLDADMVINKTLIPQARMFIKSAVLKTDNDYINLDAKGGFKRIKFDFNGKIKNELYPPYTIKNLTLALDSVDVERFLKSLNNQSKTQNETIKEKEYNEIESEEDIKQDDDYMFDTNLVRIEDCNFSLEKGKYKDLTFSDIKANLTLDKNGLLKIQSNKFNIAQGISTLKVESDLKNLKHYVRLGVKNVDTNLLAKVLFNLEKEIDGKALGLIELNTDKSLKMNGKVQFLVYDGTIGKIGLVEYLMKIVSVFRNPIAMINPGILMDIVNIPEGKFDKIEGDIKIKNNILEHINIKSYSPTLSALIRGRFDMERHDASLRVYTRFSQSTKSKFSFLRSLSLNALANKVQLNSRNDANYYSFELKDLPQIDVDEIHTQVFLTEVEGDIEHNNFLSSLRKIK